MLLSLLSSPITIAVPYNFNLKNTRDVLGGALDEDMNPRSGKIVFDFAKLNFIDPSAITVLSNLIEYLQKRGTRVRYRNFTF